MHNLNRALIGFDRLIASAERQLANLNQNYPPFNIIQHSDDRYVVEVAVTGFLPDEVEVKQHRGNLIITATNMRDKDANARYVHCGLASRNFERTFVLADHTEVVSASIENGMLSVTIEHRVPPEDQPKQIKINSN